jgi:hypothetical protein
VGGGETRGGSSGSKKKVQQIRSGWGWRRDSCYRMTYGRRGVVGADGQRRWHLRHMEWEREKERGG